MKTKELKYALKKYPRVQTTITLKISTLKLEAGEKIAIVSPLTPSANTFKPVLEGVQAPEKGWVLVNGMPIHHLRLNDYRSQVVQLSQLDIIQDTLFNNLRLNTPDLTRQQAQALLEKTGLWSKVQHFPELLDTPLLAEGRPFPSLRPIA